MKGGLQMAEEKKFLNEEMEKSNHKLMVKYIALSVVIFVKPALPNASTAFS